MQFFRYYLVVELHSIVLILSLWARWAGYIRIQRERYAEAQKQHKNDRGTKVTEGLLAPCLCRDIRPRIPSML